MIPKFRYWDEQEQKMYDNSQIVIWNGNAYQHDYQRIFDRLIRGKKGSVGRSLHDDYIMQSTEILDTNAVEIFEGDIVEWWYSEGEFLSQKEKFEVVWENGAFRPGKNSDETLYDFLEGCKGDWYPVIGNIYENPELLEME